MGLLGLAAGPKAEGARPPAPTRGRQSHLAPIRGRALGLALGHDPIHALSPEAGAGPALLTAAPDHAPDQGQNRTRQEGGADPGLAAPLLPPLLAWAPVLGLLSLNQGWEKKIKAIKC